VKIFGAFILGMVLSIVAISIVGKIYIDNLHHVACKMYDSVDDKARFDYVNKQFRCG
jgi:hypothetical protein